jgi:hypothetical protein
MESRRIHRLQAGGVLTPLKLTYAQPRNIILLDCATILFIIVVMILVMIFTTMVKYLLVLRAYPFNITDVVVSRKGWKVSAESVEGY